MPQLVSPACRPTGGQEARRASRGRFGDRRRRRRIWGRHVRCSTGRYGQARGSLSSAGSQRCVVHRRRSHQLGGGRDRSGAADSAVENAGIGTCSGDDPGYAAPPRSSGRRLPGAIGVATNPTLVVRRGQQRSIGDDKGAILIGGARHSGEMPGCRAKCMTCGDAPPRVAGAQKWPGL